MNCMRLNSRRIALLAFTSLALAACAGDCPDGSYKKGDVCVRVPQGAADVPGEASSADTSTSGARPAAATASAADAGRASGTGSALGSAGTAAASSTVGRPASQNVGGAAAPKQFGQNAGSSAPVGSSSPAAGPCSGRAGMSVCDQAMLIHCGADGTPTSTDTCMSAALCEVGSRSGVCAACSPGTFHCEDTLLQQCMDDGQYAKKDMCALAALCKEQAGACTDMVCVPNMKTCDADGSLRTCNADGSAFAEPSPCGQNLCDGTNGRCNKCVPNSKMCSGASLSTCSADGQGTNTEICPASGGDCATAMCVAGGCSSSFKLSGTACSAGGGRKCDGRGNCVECVASSDCPNKFDVCTSGQCIAGPGCGNGVLDPGETCETSGSGAYAPGTCDAAMCRLLDGAYGSCTLRGASSTPCGVNDGQGWICGGTGACTRTCSTPDQCRTTSGKGDCVPTNNGSFCAIRCSSPGSTAGCPNGQKCIDASWANLGVICGTQDLKPAM
jgi:hypothetical protein